MRCSTPISSLNSLKSVSCSQLVARCASLLELTVYILQCSARVKQGTSIGEDTMVTEAQGAGSQMAASMV